MPPCQMRSSAARPSVRCGGRFALQAVAFDKEQREGYDKDKQQGTCRHTVKARVAEEVDWRGLHTDNKPGHRIDVRTTQLS